MLQELIIFIVILIISNILVYLLQKQYFGRLQPLALRLFFVGVIVHEICHYIMNLAVGIKPEGIHFSWRDRTTGQRNPSGSVQSKPRSLAQAFFICLAPLYLGTWLIFLTLTIALNSSNIYVMIISTLFFVSILSAAAPSSQDFNNIPRAFRNSPAHSWYQVFLVLLSGVTLWVILVNTQIIFPLDVYYYFSLIGIYFMFKFSFIGSKKVILSLKLRNFRKPHEAKIRPFFRHRYKPKKPLKLR